MYNEQQSSIDKENDQFRITEKKIKKYIKKQLIKNQYQSKRQKRRNESEQMNSFDEKYGSFDWYNVVDIREIKNDNSRYTFTLIQSITNSKLSNSSTVYYVNNTPNGLYFIENALSIDQQLHWSKKALEEYSKAEHTNLTNLYKINNSNSNSKQQTDEMTIDNHEKCVDGLDLHTIENLWQISKDEPNRFQSFSKLRWSCLGYHYGKELSIANILRLL